MQLLDLTEIKQHLTAAKVRNVAIEILGSIPSTNDYLKSKEPCPQTPFSFCLAEHQTAGRGRLGKTWVSPFAANIYLSCAMALKKDYSQLSGLSLVVGLAVIKALETLGLTKKIKIKWPNDILWDGKKIAGILTEMHAVASQQTQVIIGIGLNVNMPFTTHPEINQAWTSMQHILGEPQNRNKIAAVLIQYLLEDVTCFLDCDDLSPFFTEWQQYDAFFNKSITLIQGKQEISGIVKGINAQGHLLLQQFDGSLCAFSSGDVSIKKNNFAY